MIDLKNPNKKEVYDKFATILKEKHVAEIPFSLPQEVFNSSAKHFFNFLSLPQEIKDKFYIQPSDDPRDSGVGYVRKLQKMGELDNKEFFHYHPSLEERHFKALLEEKNPLIDNFFESARKIFKESEKTLKEITDLLETQFSGINEKIFPLSEEYGTVLRFLKYDVAGMGNFLAKGHYDMGACTLALAESATGLRVGTNNKDLNSAKRVGDTAFFMAGFNFPFITNNELIPTWHDVVQESEDTFNEETARWAIVFFVGARGIPLPSHKETHTPLT